MNDPDNRTARIQGNANRVNNKSTDTHSVLFICDDAAISDRFQKNLIASGFDVHLVESIPRALQTVSTLSPDLMLIDQRAVKNVFETFDDGRTLLETRKENIPIVFLYDESIGRDQREYLIDRGVSALLSRSAGPAELENLAITLIQSNISQSREMGMKKAFKKTEYEYQELIENVNDLIFTLDEEGHFRFINRQLYPLTGHLRGEWVGKSLFDLVVVEDRQSSRDNVCETLKGKAKIFEIRVRCTDGKIRYLSANINPIFEKGKVVGVAGIARDTTQRKKLEQEIVDLKNFNESIIQSMQSGLITLNLDNRITSFNASAEEVLGYKAREVYGRPLQEILTESVCDKILPNIADHGHSLLNREVTVPTKSGNEVHIGFTVTSRFDNDNKQVGTIISFRDISEIKHLQAEMIHMDRQASLGVLASGIAHEIKNPLAGIKTMAQSLQEDFEPDNQHREYLERIVRQVDRLDSLLKTFFSFARPRQPIRKLYKLQEIVQEVYALIGQKLKSRNIHFETSYAESMPAIFVDFDQIQQVFLNLLLNAIDAIGNEGTITLKAREIRTSLKAFDRRRGAVPLSAKESLFVEVQLLDSGCGIEQKNLRRIFDPFFTTKPQGSGLGLSIVYRIVNEHGGEIHTESELGLGTKFTILIPTEEKSESEYPDS